MLSLKEREGGPTAGDLDSVQVLCTRAAHSAGGTTTPRGLGTARGALELAILLGIPTVALTRRTSSSASFRRRRGDEQLWGRHRTGQSHGAGPCQPFLALPAWHGTPGTPVPRGLSYNISMSPLAPPFTLPAAGLPGALGVCALPPTPST